MRIIINIIILTVFIYLTNCRSTNYKRHKIKRKRIYNGNTRDIIINKKNSRLLTDSVTDKRFFGKQLGFSYDQDKEAKKNKPTILKNKEKNEEPHNKREDQEYQEEHEEKEGIHTGYKDEENWGARQEHKPKIKDDLMHHDDNKGEKLFGGGKVDHDEHTKNSNNLMSKLGFTFHGGRVHMDEDGHLAQGSSESKDNSLIGGRGGQYHSPDEEDDEEEEDDTSHDYDHEKEDMQKSSSKSNEEEDDEDDEVSANHHIGPFPFAPLPQGYHKGRGPTNEPDDDEEDRVKDEKEEEEEKEEEALSDKEKEEEEEDMDDMADAKHHKHQKKFSEADQNPYHHQEHVSISGEESDKETVGLPGESLASGGKQHLRRKSKNEKEKKKSAHNIVFVLDGKESLKEIQSMKGLNDVIKTLTGKAQEENNKSPTVENATVNATEEKNTEKPGNASLTEQQKAPVAAEQDATVVQNVTVIQVNQTAKADSAGEVAKPNVTVEASQLIPTISKQVSQVPVNNLMRVKEEQESVINQKSEASPIQNNNGVLSSLGSASAVKTDTASAAPSQDIKELKIDAPSMVSITPGLNQIQSPSDSASRLKEVTLYKQPTQDDIKHEILSPSINLAASEKLRVAEEIKPHASEITSPNENQESLNDKVSLKQESRLVENNDLQRLSIAKQLHDKLEQSKEISNETPVHEQVIGRLEQVRQRESSSDNVNGKPSTLLDKNSNEIASYKPAAVVTDPTLESHFKLTGFSANEKIPLTKPALEINEAAPTATDIELTKMHTSQQSRDTSEALLRSQDKHLLEVRPQPLNKEEISKERLSGLHTEIVKIIEPNKSPVQKEHSALTVAQLEEMKEDAKEKGYVSRLPTSKLANPREEQNESDSEKNSVAEFKEPAFQRISTPEKKIQPHEVTPLVAPDPEEKSDKQISIPMTDTKKALLKKALEDTESSFSKIRPETTSDATANHKPKGEESLRAVSKDHTAKFEDVDFSPQSSFYNAENLSKEDLSPKINKLSETKVIKDGNNRMLHCEKCDTSLPRARGSLESNPSSFDLVFVKMNKGERKHKIPVVKKGKKRRKHSSQLQKII